MEILNKHISIRKFKKKEIENHLLESIIYSGTRASTTGNMQMYSIVISTDKDTKKKLLPLHFNQPVVKSAPVILTFVADINRFTKWCNLNSAIHGYNNFLWFYTATVDAILVAQNVCIAAENTGLGICYLGTTVYNAREIIDILQLPKLTFPVTSVAIGYPDEKPDLTDRLPLKGIMHKGGIYTDYSDNEIMELFALKENLESSKKFIMENNKENLAQVFTDVRYKKSDNEYFSEKMLETLKLQGFMQ